ncbi:MAG TPA: hypothetical protein VF576_02915, partial [Rubricoccaceae bacterium]
NPCAFYFAGNVSVLSNLLVVDTGHDFLGGVYATGPVDGVVLAGNANTLTNSVVQGSTRGYGVRISGDDNTVGPNQMFQNNGANAEGDPDGYDVLIEAGATGNVVLLRPGQKCLDLSPEGANFVTYLSGSGAAEGYAAPTLINGWVNFGGQLAPAGYVRDGTEVRLRGTVKSGVVGDPIFVLPAGLWPPWDYIGVGMSVVGGVRTACQIYVNGVGEVSASSGTNTDVSLNGVSFSLLP